MVERRTRFGIADNQYPLIEHRGHLDPEFNVTFRPLAGAQQNNRGNARNVVLATFAGGPAQFVPSIVETPKNSGDDAEVVTLQLSTDLPESIANPGGDHSAVDLEIVGVLEWGVGGSFYTAEIDWNQGVCFAVVGNVVRISARVGPIAAIAFPDITITLHASLGYGNALSPTVSSSVRRTVNLGNVPAGGTSGVFPIPQWALGVTIVDAGQVGGIVVAEPNYDVQILAGSLGPVVAQYKMLTRSNLGLQLEGQFPIPIKGRFFSVTNNLGMPAQNVQAIFNLGF